MKSSSTIFAIVGTLAASTAAGCVNPRFVTRVDTAYLKQFGPAEWQNDVATGVDEDGNPRGDLPLEGFYILGSAGINADARSLPLSAEMTTGPAMVFPLESDYENSDLVLWELTGRLYFLNRKFHARPFLGARAGIGYTTGRQWYGEGTRRMFSAGGSIGISLKASETVSIDAAYMFYHVSNGEDLFGSDPPNAGYNSDALLLGVTAKF